MPKYAGIDPSLTSTGVVTYDTETGAKYVASFGSPPDKGTVLSKHERLSKLASKIVEGACKDGIPDYVAIEGPAYSSNMGKVWDRAGLWWYVVDTLTRMDIPVVEIPPTSRAKLATGKGNAGKDEVLLAVSRTFLDFDIKNNDHADALVLCSFIARMCGHPFDGDLPKNKLDAITKVQKDLKWQL